MKKDCVFCKIAKGEIPDYRIWENDNFFAMLDINPVVKGHTLIIPKKHSRWVWDMKEKDYEEYMQVVRKIAEVLKKTFNTKWIELIIAGMGVEHSHIHVLPRKFDDGIPEIPIKPLIPKPSEKEMKEITERIKVALGRI